MKYKEKFRNKAKVRYDACSAKVPCPFDPSCVGCVSPLQLPKQEIAKLTYICLTSLKGVGDIEVVE